MCAFNEKLKTFAVDLYKINAIKFGEYKTKVGLTTPVYCDLRVIVSYPQLLETLAELILEYLKNLEKFDIICGVPYTALPIATVVSVKSNIPMVMRRKEAKDYGTKKLIEGHFQEGDNCLIIEDVVTSGSSILETVKDLKDSGIKCNDSIVLLNREQGGAQLLLNNGIKMHALLTMTQLMSFLKEANCITESDVDKVQVYLRKTQVDPNLFKKDKSRLKLSFSDRVKFAKNPIAKNLLQIMANKKTTLCVAADVTDATELLNLAEALGPHICLLKTHIDVIEDFHINLIKNLKGIAERHNFILFEDRKFADIGNTVQLQYSQGVYQISSWASLVTAHSIMGKGTLEGLRESDGLKERGVFLLAEASSVGSLTDQSYVNTTLKLAKEFENLIAGIVCQNPLIDEPGLIQLTPGCHLESAADRLSQQYNSPETVVLEKGADIAVVGRGITKAKDPVAEAEKYKQSLWAAYKKRLLD